MSHIDLEQQGRVCTITLNRPEKRNLLSVEMLGDLHSAIERLKLEDKTRCIVIKGAGDKVFSSGYDITAIGDSDMLRDYESDHPLSLAVDSIENFPYPVIAMINGHTFGAGLEIAVTCDIRVARAGSKLAIPPAKLGVAYTFSGLKKFLKLIGPGYTKELFLIGRPISSERACEIGLVNFTVPSEDLERFTMDMAVEIAENAPLSLITLKEMTNAWQRNVQLSETEQKVVRELLDKLQNSADYKEGRRAFSEKRKPVFKGE